ncbi:DUF2510 domain-containing protein [Agromyces sp. NPDC127015]|uniref:DUF2510 domain-containing protein n=1 Tax=Agromyces sp. NPDC127015 TaxID=3347108 RepID=UPI0036464AE6
MSTPTTTAAPAGWYDDGSGRLRWWNGAQWTEHFAPPPAPPQQTHSMGPMTSSSINVQRQAVYTRQQTGHSLILHLILGAFCLWINVIYISASPNHYWHA